ncbi:MAG: outer membrane beta-barrel protein [Actinomycetota bacterium]
MSVALVAFGGAIASAETAIEAAFDYQLICCETPACCDEPSCGCEDPSCGCDDGCCGDNLCGDGCCGDACGDACGCGSACGLGGCSLGACCLGDPFTLKGHLDPCGCCPVDFGGWTQFGFHSDNARLSVTDNDGLAFNDNDDRLNLHQQWLWFEKVADGSCGLDWGFRADIMYGTDAAKTQAFGNDPGEWDFANGWDRGGGYGWAMPQLYGEVAYGDLSIIAGHFYTLIGYEVVTAPDNFFYSHALTMFNSEPFTHTGALATYSGLDNVELYAGWTAGWDTGFDDSLGGSSWLGGFSTNLTDDIAFTYISTAGNFGARSGGEDGYSHSLVFDVALSDDLNYVFQSDVVGYDANAVNGGIANDQVGINQYLFYTINDCWAAGGRMEWWKSDGSSFQALTMGLNYRPHANVVIRPEVRYDWTGSDAAAQFVGYNGQNDYENWSFGMDAVITF